MAFLTSLQSSPSSTDLPDLSSMRVGEIKKELESYNISTKSFLEKSELFDALKRARENGCTPISSNIPSDGNSSTSSNHSFSREELIGIEMKKCETMKASELKGELESLNISTKSFFEKSEFVRAVAEARVNGVKNKSPKGSGDGEEYAEYADVEVMPMDDPSGPKQTQQQSSTNRSSPPPSGNFFGGGMADMFQNMVGGGGGGANMADMFQNMGGMAGMFQNMGGGNNMMGKAQELMKNPKVMEILGRAQSNPKIRNAVMECMSNPAAFAKYQNDPEISGLINELRPYIM